MIKKVPKLTDKIILEMMRDCPSELCDVYEGEICERGVCNIDECDRYQLEQYKKSIYQRGRADREKELSELPNEYSDKLWKIAYERGRANERNEILSMLTTLTKKQKSHYKSMPNGYARAKEKGRFWGLERARFQVDLRNEEQSND